MSKSSSFDRIFPVQDHLGPGEIGNLIALPFHGEAAKRRTTLLLDSGNGLKPHGETPGENIEYFLENLATIDEEEVDLLLKALGVGYTEDPRDAGSITPRGNVNERLAKLVEGCDFLRHCRDDAAELPEPHWHKMICLLASQYAPGRAMIHELSKNYPGYTFQECEKKIDHAQRDCPAPPRCEAIKKDWGCQRDCGVATPLNLLRTQSRNDFSEDSEVIPNIFLTDDKLFPAIPFPFDALHSKLSQFICKLAKVIQVPPEPVAGAAFTILSAGIGNSIWVSPKSGWQTSLFIWLIVIEITGGGKSPFMNFLLDIVYKVQSEFYREFKNQLAEWERMRRTNKNKACPTENEKPLLQHIITSDTTTEALGRIFCEWPRGLVIHNDELSGLILGLNQYKKGIGNDRQKYLQLFDAAPFKIDRKGETIMTERSGASILGGIQPEIISQIFDESAFEDGLFPRFLVIYQEQTLRVFNDQSLSESEVSFWENLYRRCLMLPWEMQGKPKSLIFSEDARRVWSGFHDESYKLATLMSKNGAVFVPKLITYSLRLIGLLHLLDYLVDTLTITDLENLPPPRPFVDRATAERGIRLTRYFAGQTMKVLSAYGKNYKSLNGQTVRLIQTLFKLTSEVRNGVLPLTRLRDEFNCGLPTPAKLGEDNKMLSGMLRGLGIETKRTGAGGFAHLIWEQEKLDKLFRDHVTIVTDITDFASKGGPDKFSPQFGDDSDDSDVFSIIDLTEAESIE